MFHKSLCKSLRQHATHELFWISLFLSTRQHESFAQKVAQLRQRRIAALIYSLALDLVTSKVTRSWFHWSKCLFQKAKNELSKFLSITQNLTSLVHRKQQKLEFNGLVDLLRNKKFKSFGVIPLIMYIQFMSSYKQTYKQWLQRVLSYCVLCERSAPFWSDTLLPVQQSVRGLLRLAGPAR